MKRRCPECGRLAVSLPRRGKNRGRRGYAVSLPGHDLCLGCHRKSQDRFMSKCLRGQAQTH